MDSDQKFVLKVFAGLLLLGPPAIVFIIWYTMFCLELVMGPIQ